MNKVFKIVWNQTLQSWVVVSEFAKSRGKPSATVSSIAVAALMAASPSFAATVAIGGAEDIKNVGSRTVEAAVASGSQAVAIGQKAKASGTSTVALGDTANASGINAVAVGYSANATHNYAVAVGVKAKAQASGTVAIGNNATATHTGSIVLGDNSVSAGDNTVSVGSASKKRRITNVANGSIAANSSDVVTGGQLHAELQKLQTAGSSTSSAKNYFHVNPTGQSVTGSATNLDTVDGAGGAKAARSLAAGVNAQVESEFSMAIGDGAKITKSADKLTATDGKEVEGQQESSNSLAVGSNAMVTGQKSVAIGYKANVTAPIFDQTSGVAIGDEATVNAKSSVAIGHWAVANATGQGSAMALGDQSEALSTYALAMGTRATASGDHSTAIAKNAKAYSQYGVSIGVDAVAGELTQQSTKVAETADEKKISTTVLETDPKTGTATKIRVQDGTNVIEYTVKGYGETAIGKNTLASGSRSTAIGIESKATGDHATAIANNAKASALRSTAIGNLANASSAYALAVGDSTQASGSSSMAVGQGANASGMNSGAIGKGANSTGVGGFAIGTGSKALENHVLAIGTNSITNTRFGIAMGNEAQSGTDLTTGFRAVAIGNKAKALSNDAIAFGTNAKAEAVTAIAMGNNVSNSGSSSIAIGDNVTVSAARSVALGRNIKVTKEENVVLGSWSTETSATITNAGEVAPITEATVGDVTYGNFAGANSVGVVSVGRDKNDAGGGDGLQDGERRLINVGAGEISERSTDAINGSQLYSVIKNTFFNLETYENGGVADDSEVTDEENKRIRSGDTFALGAGSGINISQVDKGYEIAIEKGDIQVNTDTGAVTTADAETDGKVATAYDVVNAISKSGFKVKSGSTGTGNNSTEGDLKTNGELINPADTLTYIAGDNLDVSHTKDGNFTFKTKENVTFNTVTANTSLTIGTGTGLTNLTSTANGLNVANSTGGATKITNVANGEVSATSKDAINGSQLNSFMQTVNQGKWTLSTSQDDGNKQKVGDINLEDGVVIDGKGAVKVTSTKEAATVSKVHIAVATDNTTISQTDGTLKAVTTTLTTDGDGKATATTGTSLVTGDQVADAINKAGLKFKGDVASADGGANTFKRNNQDETSIIGGQADRTKLSDENNIGVVSNSQNELKIKLAKDIKVDSVNATNNVTIGGTVVSKADNGLSFATGAAKTILDGITSGLKTLNSGNGQGLLDLTTLPTGTTANTAATVGDLQNMGWVVSSDKTTSGTGAYNAQVKNSNEVRFIGTGIATVSGKNEGDIRTITVDVKEKSAQNVVQEAQLPVVYAKADGTKVVKATDGNFYPADQVNTDGSLKNPATATVVPTTDVIASLNSGANSTTAPTALSNVKSNLDEARNAASTVTDAGKTHTAEAAAPTAANKNNAATVGDVLNAGWNLKENNTAKDFVKAYDTVNFVNGKGTTANVSMNADGTVANVTFNVNTTTLSVADGATTGQPKGSISTPTNADNFVTAGNLATAINGAGFTVFENNGANEKSLVNAGDKVSFNNGNYTTAQVGTEANNTTNVTFNVDGAKLVADNSPVVYTDKAGNKVVKGTDGNYYQAKADGTPDTTKRVEPDNIVASMQNITNGNQPTAGNVFTLTNVKSNLPTVNDATTVITNPDGTTVAANPANIKAAPLTAAQAVNLMQNSANNAATLGDVLNAGWNLQGNGNAVDFVKPFDTVNFKDGANTKVVADSNGTTSNVTVNVVGLPVAYTTAEGEPVVKFGDKFYKVDAQGNRTGNALTDEEVGKLVANVINPKADPNKTGGAITLGNIASAVKTLDGSNRGDKVTAPTAIDATSPLGIALKTAYSGLADLVNAPQNHAVTVADLRNLGWVVSATGNNYADDVRHANEVRFVGTGLAKVTGETDSSGVRTITVDVNAQNTVEAAQTPVVYTNAKGDKLYKHTDGKFYTQTGGQGDVVQPIDVIASMNAGDNKTSTPTTLANVKSNLADAGTLAAQPDANKPSAFADKKNNAATVGDVLNAGWNLQGNGKAVDTVIHNDTVDFVNGKGTTVTVAKDASGKNTIKVDSAIEFVNATTTDTSTPSTTAKLTGTAPVQLGNVASGVRKADGSTPTGKDLADAVAKASGNTLTNAVNVGDLQAVAKAATTKVDGDQGVSVKPTANADGSTTYTVAAKTDGTTIKVDSSGNLAAVTSELKNKADGKVDTPAAPNALVTAQTVADAINNAGFNLQANGDTASLVKTGDTVQFLNGKNIEITRNGNNITVATAKEVEFDKVTVGPVTIDKTNGINAGNKQIKGVAEGTDGTDAVNVNQLKTETAKAKTEVTGTGFAVVTSKTGDKGQTIYNVDVAKADTPTVTRGSVTVKADDENKVMSAGDVAKAITNSEKTSSVKAGSKAVTVTNTAEDAKGNTEYTVDVATDKTIARDNDGKLTVNTGSSLKVDGTTGKIDVNTDGTTITTDATGAVKANTTALTNAANGKVNTPTAPNALATAGDIVNAINSSGFTLKTSANGGSKVSGADEVINPGEAIDMAAGKNLTVKQEANGKVTYATAENVSFTTVNSTTVVVGNPADPSKSTTLTSGNGGLNVGGDKITGVAVGDISPTSTDAVNGSQLYNLQQVVGGNTLNAMTTTPVQLNNGTTVNVITSNGYTLKTYNVKDKTNYVTNNMVEAIGRMNEEGIKFFHVNDENVNKSKVQSSNDVDSSASGAYSAAIGYQAVADGDASVALGKKAIAAEENAIAIGINAQANAKNTISIGNGNIVNGENSGAIGDPSKIDADNSYSVGNNNEIAAGQSDVFALGNDVKATASNSVFLGSKSGTFEQENATVGTNGVHKKTASSHYTYNGENDSNVAGVNNAVGVVSVGNSQETRQVQGVAAGVVSATSTDAINGSQLYYTNKAINDKLKNVGDTINKLGDTINKNNKDLRGGIAGTNAAASLPQVYLPGKSMVAASAGTYKGQGAIAVGYSRASDNGKLILKLQGNANTRGDVGAGIGIGYQW